MGEWGHIFKNIGLQQKIHPLWRIECCYGKGGPIWKGEDDLSPSGKIM